MRTLLCGLLTLALVVGSIQPAVAQAGASPDSVFRLRLAEVLPPDVLALQVGSPTVQDPAPSQVQFANMGRLSVAEAGRLAAQEAAPSAAAPQKRGAGAWLKRHWWVPALAGAALGALLIDSGDSDATGEED